MVGVCSSVITGCRDCKDHTNDEGGGMEECDTIRYVVMLYCAYNNIY